MKGVLVIATLVALSAAAAANGCPQQLLPDFRDCAAFWQCADGAPLFQTCPQGLHFSARLQRCTLPVFARCHAAAGDSPVHRGFMSGILDKLRNVISKKAEPLPPVEDAPELPSDSLPNEEDKIQRFPEVEARVADGDTDEAEKSVEDDSENEEQKSADEGVKSESDTKEEGEQKAQEEDGKEEEQDESERSEEKIEEEEGGLHSGKEEDEEKIEEKSDVEDVATVNDGEKTEDSKKDVTLLKKKEEEEEDENKKKSKDVKRKEKESKKNKEEEKEKDSESDAESDDED